jgi:hypothetical protein
MGRFDPHASETCSVCGAHVDVRFLERHRHHHRCNRDYVLWDEAPDFTSSSEFIGWYGTCPDCGRRVYDCYIPEGPIYDAGTNDEVKPHPL